MNKLREKLNCISCSDCNMPHCDIKCTMLSDNEIDTLEQIADEFAIVFADWLELEETEQLILNLQMNGELPKEPTKKQLLEIYKKTYE